MAAHHALAGFTMRVTMVAGFGCLVLLALFGFALAGRAGQPPAKVLRGARLMTGATGRRAFAKACRRECRHHGRGIELLPPYALSREREARHFLILGSVGGGKTQTMLHLIIEAISRGDGVLVLDTKGDMMAGPAGCAGAAAHSAS